MPSTIPLGIAGKAFVGTVDRATRIEGLEVRYLLPGEAVAPPEGIGGSSP